MSMFAGHLRSASHLLRVTPMLDPELVKTAKGFLQGKLSLGDLEAWLAGVDDDDPELSEESKEAAATLRLLCIGNAAS